MTNLIKIFLGSSYQYFSNLELFFYFLSITLGETEGQTWLSPAHMFSIFMASSLKLGSKWIFMLITSPTIKITKKMAWAASWQTLAHPLQSPLAYLHPVYQLESLPHHHPPAHLLSNKTGPVLKRSSLQFVKHGSQPLQKHGPQPLQTNLN